MSAYQLPSIQNRSPNNILSNTPHTKTYNHFTTPPPAYSIELLDEELSDEDANLLSRMRGIDIESNNTMVELSETDEDGDL